MIETAFVDSALMGRGIDDSVPEKTQSKKPVQSFQKTRSKFDVAAPFVLVKKALIYLLIWVDRKVENAVFLPMKIRRSQTQKTAQTNGFCGENEMK